MLRILSCLFLLTAACTPLTLPGADAGDDDAGADAGPVAVDAGICDGGFCPPERVTAELIDPWDLAVDATNVYWLEWGLETGGTSGQVMKQPKNTACLKRDAGCAVDLNMNALGRFRVDTMTLANGELCWTENYANARDVVCQSLTTNLERFVARNQPYATRPIYAAGELLWVNQGSALDGTVMRIAADAPAGTMPAQVARRRPVPNSVAVMAGQVVWAEAGSSADAGAVFAAAPGGGTTQLASLQPNPLSVIACDGGVYWANYRGGTIMRASLVAESAVQLVGGQRAPFQVVCDATHLYWLNAGVSPTGADGALWQARLDGSEATPMVQGIPVAWALAIDDTYIYYVAQGTQVRTQGVIWRIRKHP